MSMPAPASFHFDTDSYPANDRYDLWREVMAVTHDVEFAKSEPFRVRVGAWSLGQVVVTSGQTTAQTFVRTPDHIRHDHLDHVGLFVQGVGTRLSFVGDIADVMRENEIQVIDFAQPDRSMASAGTSGTLYLPRSLVEQVIPDVSRFHGMILRDSMAAFFARYILSMGQELPALPPAALTHLTHATVEMALACLHSLESGTWEPSSAVVSAIRQRVERYIETQLAEPNLTPDSIARACDMSRTALYRLFEQHGGVMAHVKRRRLHRVRSILIANEDTRSLAGISEDYGFQSGAHFSREFRREFGYAPGEARGNLLPLGDTSAAAVDLGPIFRSLFA